MADSAQIMCINKHPRNSTVEHIQYFGGAGSNGVRWKASLADMIGYIESGKWQFYVSVGGKTAWVVIAISAAGHKYLKTQADGLLVDNLLSLPECP